jgi:hypothetical protein
MRSTPRRRRLASHSPNDGGRVEDPRILPARRRVLAELRDDHHALARAAQGLAQDALALAIAVAVRRVEERDARVDGGLDLADGPAPRLGRDDGVRLLAPAEPGHAGRAQSQRADAQTTPPQPARLHHARSTRRDGDAAPARAIRPSIDADIRITT